MDFSKASNSISHQLTLIFPESCQIFLGGSGGLGWLVGLGGWVPCVGLAAGAPEGREG